MGTHEQLMEQDGHYREIAAAQLYGDEFTPTDPSEAPSHMKRVQSDKEVAAAIASADKSALEKESSES
jgi:hypothetical protein